MAKTDFPTWMKFSISVLIILAIGVGWGVGYNALATVGIRNTTDIAIVKSDQKNHAEKNVEHEAAMTERVHQIEINQQRDVALKENLLGTMVRLESKMDSFCTEQAQIKLDVNTTKVKVETLTKD